MAQVSSCEFFKFLRTSFFKEHLWWLLLHIEKYLVQLNQRPILYENSNDLNNSLNEFLWIIMLQDKFSSMLIHNKDHYGFWVCLRMNHWLLWIKTRGGGLMFWIPIQLLFLSYRCYRSSRSQMFFEIGVLKFFAIFTGKHLCWSLTLIKLQALQLY